MGGRSATADDTPVAVRPFLAVLVGALTLAALVGASTTASAGRACISGARAGGYSYAGHQATFRGHGVRATIKATRAPSVEAGHVAGWVGVGGPGQGANGEDAWIQAGIASMPGMDTFLYAEVTRPGRAPEFILIAEGVAIGESHKIAVLEMSGRPGWWRVWVDGNAMTEPIRLRGSSGRWAPIATAESWNGRHGPRATHSASGSSASRSPTAAAARGGRSSPLTASSTARTRCGTSRLRLPSRAPTAVRLRARASCHTRSSRFGFVAARHSDRRTALRARSSPGGRPMTVGHACDESRIRTRQLKGGRRPSAASRRA